MKPRFKPTDWYALPVGVKKEFIHLMTNMVQKPRFTKGWCLISSVNGTFAVNRRDDWFKAAR